jgi:hypothetical protein
MQAVEVHFGFVQRGLFGRPSAPRTHATEWDQDDHLLVQCDE